MYWPIYIIITLYLAGWVLELVYKLLILGVLGWDCTWDWETILCCVLLYYIQCLKICFRVLLSESVSKILWQWFCCCFVLNHVKYLIDIGLIDIDWIPYIVGLGLLLHSIESQITIDPYLSFALFVKTYHVLVWLDWTIESGNSIESAVSWS